MDSSGAAISSMIIATDGRALARPSQADSLESVAWWMARADRLT